MYAPGLTTRQISEQIKYIYMVLNVLIALFLI